MAKEKFDLKTHIRDKHGNIIETKPYRLIINKGERMFERPPGSGVMYYENGDLVDKEALVKHEAKLEAMRKEAEDRKLKPIKDLELSKAREEELAKQVEQLQKELHSLKQVKEEKSNASKISNGR